MTSNIIITFRLDRLECAQCSTCLFVLLMFVFFIITLLSIVILDLFISLAGDEHNITFLRIWCLIYEGLYATFHLQKCLVIKVNITSMFSCFISFPLCFGGRSDSCDCKKNYGPTCVA
jgi:hypothetical protein